MKIPGKTGFPSAINAQSPATILAAEKEKQRERETPVIWHNKEEVLLVEA